MGASRLFVQQSVIGTKLLTLGILSSALAAILPACATSSPIASNETAGGALVMNERIGDGLGIGTGLSNAKIRTPKPTRDPGFAPAGRTPPVDPAEAEVGVFTIPPASTDPLGEIRIEVIGRTQISLGSRAPEAPPIDALQVRLKVENSTSNEWTLDTRLQTLSLADTAGLRPTFARAEQEPPFIKIPGGTSRELELFYILPDNAPSAAAMERLQLSWNVLTDQGIESEVATFRPVGQASVSATTLGSLSDDVEPEPPSEQPYETPLSGPTAMPYWWRDPFAPTPYLWRDLIY